MNLQAAFFDIDGTLVSTKGEIGPLTTKAIQTLVAQGVLCGVATGRPLFGVTEILKRLPWSGPHVVFSGALILGAGGVQSKEEPLEAAWIATLRHHPVLSTYYTEWYSRDEYVIEASHPLAALHAAYLDRAPIIAPVADYFIDRPLLKFVIASENSAEIAQAEEALAQFPALSVAKSTGSTNHPITFLNVTSRAASRQSAWDYIVNSYHLDASRIAAFGDAPSDLPFITRAGFGVAMANAPATVRERARFVCGSCEEDGVGRFLHPMLSSGS